MLISCFVMEYWLIYHALCQVPILSVHRAIKSWPFLLGCSTSKLKLMVEEFGELGIQNKKLGQVIAKSPQLLLRKPREVLQVGVICFYPILWHVFIVIYFIFPFHPRVLLYDLPFHMF